MPIVIKVNGSLDDLKKLGDTKTANAFRIFLVRSAKLTILEFVLATLAVLGFIITYQSTDGDEEAAQIVFLAGISLMVAVFIVGTIFTIFKVVRAVLRKKN